MASVSAHIATPTPVEISSDFMAIFRVVAPMVAPVKAAWAAFVTADKPTMAILAPAQTTLIVPDKTLKLLMAATTP